MKPLSESWSAEYPVRVLGWAFTNNHALGKKKEKSTWRGQKSMKPTFWVELKYLSAGLHLIVSLIKGKLGFWYGSEKWNSFVMQDWCAWFLGLLLARHSVFNLEIWWPCPALQINRTNQHGFPLSADCKLHWLRLWSPSVKFPNLENYQEIWHYLKNYYDSKFSVLI